MKKITAIILLVVLVLLVGFRFYKTKLASNPSPIPQEMLPGSDIPAATKDLLRTTEADNGKTISLAVGQRLLLTLGTPGEEGNDLLRPEYDTSLLRLVDRQDMSGVAIWTFAALKTGSTDLSINGERPSDQRISRVFRMTVSIE